MKLELRNTSVRYGTGRNAITALDGIDLTVGPGETLGLVGESGCGKSTVARAIVGLVPISGGQILLDGKDCSPTRSRATPEFRRRVQMIFQDPYSSLNPRMSVGEMLTEALALVPGSQRASRRAQALELLELVGLPSNSLSAYPHQFSGGQRQRLAIARALALKPELILHDEVTSALDVSVQGSILNLLRELQRRLNLSYLFISHDLSTVRYMSDRMAVMYLGRIVENAETEELFAGPCHPYTSALIGSIPQVGRPRRVAPLSGDLPDPRNPPQGCRFHTRCPVGPVVDASRLICMETDPQAISARMSHQAACHFARPASGPGVASELTVASGGRD
jgi:peptide/nickel transport system ATP-binding protein